MKLVFFFVDQGQQLARAPIGLVEAVWRGSRDVSALGSTDAHNLRLVAALCDRRCRPKVVFFLRLAVWNDRITEAARQLAYQTVTSVISSRGDDVDRSLIEYHASGWPRDWQVQLAVALDCPVKKLDKFALGGPLPVSDLMGVSVPQSLRFFKYVAQQ